MRRIIRIFFFLTLSVVFVSSCTAASTGEPPLPTIALVAPTSAVANEEVTAKEAAPSPSAPEEELATPTQQATSTPQPPTPASPTPTAAPSPTLSSGPIDLPELNRTRPEDVFPQITYFAGGGGDASDCSQIYHNNTDDWMQYPPHIAYIRPEGDVEWRKSIHIITCGWVPGERIFFRPFREDKSLDIGGQTHADDWGGVDISLTFTADYLPGSYTFIFNGENARLTYTFNLKPEDPTVYHLFDANKEDTGELLLSGFPPGEIVRLLKYEGSSQDTYYVELSFAGWTTVQVGPDGRLTVFIPKDAGRVVNYAAIGEQSGVAKSFRDYKTMGLWEMAGPVACPPAQLPRLSEGMRARVVADQISVRDEPGTAYEGSIISKGSIVTILTGPVCTEGMLWWWGETDIPTWSDGYQHNLWGWMAEERSGEWLLEPVQ